MLVILSLMFACSGSTDTKTKAAAPATAAPKSESSTVDSAQLSEALKVADAADGVEDKVAHKCAGCALGMDGSADHAVEVDGYTLHLCSSMCKTYFSKDISGNVVQLLQ